MAGGYQQTEGNQKPDAAGTHHANTNPSLPLGKSHALLLVLKVNEISSEVVG
jgi:hypothetical protein